MKKRGKTLFSQLSLQTKQHRENGVKEATKMAKSKPAKINTERTFGVEVEFLYPEEYPFTEDDAIDKIVSKLEQAGIQVQWERYSHRTVNHWKLVKDCSVIARGFHGFELVSPVLKWDRIDELVTAVDVLFDIGCCINGTCGLHVHHDVRDYSSMDFIRIFELYISCEDELDKLVHPNRRSDNNIYCHSLKQLDIKVARKRLEEISCGYETCGSDGVAVILDQIDDDILSNGNRYIKLNADSYRSYGTIEFRHYHGCLDPNTIKAWILLTQRIVETAKTQSRFNQVKRSWVEMTCLLRFMRQGKEIDEEIIKARKLFDTFRSKAEEALAIGLEHAENTVFYARTPYVLI